MSDGTPVLRHSCSGRTYERCHECDLVDTRDAFEGWVTTEQGKGLTKFYVCCPGCEAEHPDQSDHDTDGCEACDEEGVYD